MFRLRLNAIKHSVLLKVMNDQMVTKIRKYIALELEEFPAQELSVNTQCFSFLPLMNQRMF